MRKLAVLLALALAAAGMLTAVPAQAATPTLRCGATLTHSVRLDRDLSCRSGDGLTINGNVTLNLGGHRLLGNRSGIGVLLTSGHIRIENGRIEGWQQGAANNPYDFNEIELCVQHVTFAGNSIGLNPAPASATVGWSSFEANGTAFTGSPLGGHTSITHSTFTGNDIAAEIDDNVSADVSYSTFAHNRLAVSSGGGNFTVTHSVLRANTYAADEVCVTDSQLSYNTYGLIDGLDPACGARDVFEHNSIAVFADTASVTNSRFAYNVTAIKTRTQALDMTIIGNLFVRNGSAVDVARPDYGGYLAVGHNGAFFNRHFGIYAPGAVDLGHNTAYGNGYQPQCTGVHCASSASGRHPSS